MPDVLVKVEKWNRTFWEVLHSARGRGRERGGVRYGKDRGCVQQGVGEGSERVEEKTDKFRVVANVSVEGSRGGPECINLTWSLFVDPN